MIIGILAETGGEKRVALSPTELPALKKLGLEKILVERGAGAGAFFSDAAYEANGATITSFDEIYRTATIILHIQPFSEHEIGQMQSGQIVVGQFNPLGQRENIPFLQKQNVSAFSLDLAPRSTRAQALDVLSSMATVAGYKAVLVAAASLPSFLPMFMTAAGTIKPAKVLILGAGVAGLQAIATAKRLGAIVEAFDVRAAAKEEVLSLGAKFVEVEGAVENKAAGGYAIEQTDEFKAKQAQLIHDHAAQADIIICTAQVPGRKAPLLIRKETVAAMKPGSVIVDLAASSGGNCGLTENGETIEVHGVKIIGNSNLPASLPRDASALFSKNMLNFLKLVVVKGEINLNFEDDIIAATCVTHGGEVVSERLKA